MEFSARQIAEILQGSVDGDEKVLVHRLSKIEEGEPGTLTFLANKKYEPFIYTAKASIAIVNKDFAPESTLPETLTLIRVKDAYGAFATLLQHYNTYRHQRTGVDSTAIVSQDVKLGEGVYIGHQTVILQDVRIGDHTKVYGQCYIGEGVRLGKNCIIHPGVRLLDDTIIGDDCVVHSGTVIGSDGFGFAPSNSNEYKKVAQIGNVVIEDHVEIGANTTIDRATLGSTFIRKGVKLDNLIQVAHNVDIGENTVIAAQTGIAGSTKIGKNCMIGGQVGLVGHITIADGVKIAAQSGISASILKEGEVVQGSPAFPIRNYKMSYIGFRRLPEMEDRLRKLESNANDPNQANNE